MQKILLNDGFFYIQTLSLNVEKETSEDIQNEEFYHLFCNTYTKCSSLTAL